MTLSPSLSSPEEEGAACDHCAKTDALEVTWCPAWQKYLCLTCRWNATEAAHRITLAEQRALDASAREAS